MANRDCLFFFFCCARITNNRFYESFAEELVEDVCGHLTFDLAVDFADGLCGIGWSVEFLKRLGFVEGDTDEILEEIDGARLAAHKGYLV